MNTPRSIIQLARDQFERPGFTGKSDRCGAIECAYRNFTWIQSDDFFCFLLIHAGGQHPAAVRCFTHAVSAVEGQACRVSQCVDARNMRGRDLANVMADNRRRLYAHDSHREASATCREKIAGCAIAVDVVLEFFIALKLFNQRPIPVFSEEFVALRNLLSVIPFFLKQLSAHCPPLRPLARKYKHRSIFTGRFSGDDF